MLSDVELESIAEEDDVSQDKIPKDRPGLRARPGGERELGGVFHTQRVLNFYSTV